MFLLGDSSVNTDELQNFKGQFLGFLAYSALRFLNTHLVLEQQLKQFGIPPPSTICPCCDDTHPTPK